ncbi:MAG: glycoside hydrolase [Halobacteriales archaeon]|nr:glycoside hydrolase [Halobacteriales archaeon]
MHRSFRLGVALMTLLLVLPALATVAPGTSPSGIGSGAASFVNYVSPFGGNAGETSIGVNPYTNNVMFNRFLKVDRIHFDDSVTPALATWASVDPVGAITVDPLMYTDRDTGRTYWVQNAEAANHVYFTQGVVDPTSGSTVLNDGEVWVPTEPSSTFPAFDHQNVGSGPHSVLGLAPNLKQLGVPAQAAGVANAMYTCGQIGPTLCVRSDDNGLTWGPPTSPNLQNNCMGLVGHITVDAIGTVYVPDRACGSQAGIEISRDNGIDWSLTRLPGSSSRGFAEPDPSVAVDAADHVWVAYRNEIGGNRGVPAVAYSADHGATFSDPISPDPTGTIMNSNFPVMLAGDAGRAAMVFYGATEAGDYQSSAYAGVWHLYVSFTFDNGATWTLVDATPSDPVQRGCMWMQGGGNACRNLLDFQGATLDAQGRVVVGYADGCTSAPCIGPAGTPDDSRASKGVIARQQSGRTLFAAFDS